MDDMLVKKKDAFSDVLNDITVFTFCYPLIDGSCLETHLTSLIPDKWFSFRC